MCRSEGRGPETGSREPRQVRKEATVAVPSGLRIARLSPFTVLPPTHRVDHLDRGALGDLLGGVATARDHPPVHRNGNTGPIHADPSQESRDGRATGDLVWLSVDYESHRHCSRSAHSQLAVASHCVCSGLTDSIGSNQLGQVGG